MPKEKITKEMVDRIPKAEKDQFWWDTQLPGFGVKVTPSGRKSFIMQKHVNGRDVRIKIGDFGPFTVAEARERANKIAVEAQDGIDPVAKRRQAAQEAQTAAQREITVGQLYERWMASHVRPKRSERTVFDYEQVWNSYLKETFENEVASLVRRPAVTKLHGALAHIPRRANYAVVVLKAIYNFAIREELLPEGTPNPAAKIEPYEENEREEYLTLEEIERIGDAITALVQEGLLSKYAASALVLCLFTGARSGAIKTLKWSEVDFENRQLRFKTKRKKLKVIPLNDAAIAALKLIPRVEGNPYVIVGQRTGEHMVSLRQPWDLIKKRAGIDETDRTVRIHDLRHSFASIAASSGVPIQAVSKMLGHTRIQTTMRYAHLFKDAVSQANNEIGSVIQSHLRITIDQNPPADTGN